MKSWKDISYCIVTRFGLVGSYSPDKGFSPMLLHNYKPVCRLARKLSNVSKVAHSVSIYDSDTGAVISAPPPLRQGGDDNLGSRPAPEGAPSPGEPGKKKEQKGKT